MIVFISQKDHQILSILQDHHIVFISQKDHYIVLQKCHQIVFISEKDRQIVFISQSDHSLAGLYLCFNFIYNLNNKNHIFKINININTKASIPDIIVLSGPQKISILLSNK